LIFISLSWAAKSAYSSILFRGANNSRPFKGKCLTKKPIKMKANIQEEKDAAIQRIEALDLSNYPECNFWPNNSWPDERKVRFAKKKTAAYYDVKISKAEAIENSDEVLEFSVSVEWISNRTWGANPKATIRVGFDTFKSSSISGCGYDKESTAIADAFNQSEKLRGILYKNRDKISGKYGYDKKLFTLSGGVGSDCFWMIFKACGYDVKHVACGKMYDVWNIVKI
jgi:hypothetical protein